MANGTYTSALTLTKLLEIIVAVIAILTPMAGFIWYAESKFVSLDKKLTRIELTLDCVIKLPDEVSRHVCVRN